MSHAKASSGVRRLGPSPGDTSRRNRAVGQSVVGMSIFSVPSVRMGTAHVCAAELCRPIQYLLRRAICPSSGPARVVRKDPDPNRPNNCTHDAEDDERGETPVTSPADRGAHQ